MKSALGRGANVAAGDREARAAFHSGRILAWVFGAGVVFYED
ncbi:hypothetical protein [Halomonas sp.]|nr:hypothetical protein [Halomonas sp.]MDW7748703.1 hypothetical protein [Halomonas sp.]